MFPEAVGWLRLCVAEACSNESLLSFTLILEVCYYLEVFIWITLANAAAQRPAAGKHGGFAGVCVNRKPLCSLCFPLQHTGFVFNDNFKDRDGIKQSHADLPCWER